MKIMKNIWIKEVKNEKNISSRRKGGNVRGRARRQRGG